MRVLKEREVFYEEGKDREAEKISSCKVIADESMTKQICTITQI